MNPLKRIASVLSSAAIAVGLIIEGLKTTGIVLDSTTQVGRWALGAGLAALAVRNILADKDGNGVPDIFDKMSAPAQASLLSDLRVRQKPGASSFALLLAVGLAACTPSPAVASPRPFGMAVEVVADTGLNIVVPCTADAPAVRCRFVPTATIAGRAITFGPVPDVAIGETATITSTFLAAGGDTLVVSTTSAGVNPENVAGPAKRSDNEFVWVAPFGVPGLVRSFTITVTVVRP